ncbi:MAG TPA: deaminase [Candidatus Nanoarchaeia archaeon]|nr:deaminase [Candidatus Nanoarchaeia archaeon]
MDNIIKLKDVSKLIKPYTATMVGGVFDLFHTGHLNYLLDCAKYGRPLVVIVQSDKTVRYRKGLNRPIISQDRRAKIISALEIVDYAIILDKPSHYNKYMAAIKPKTFVFSKENMKYRLNRKRIINENFPKVNVVFVKKRTKRVSTSFIVNKILEKPDYSKIKDSLKRKLYKLADETISNIGKVAALIKYKEKIVAKSSNISKKDVHAEVIAIKQAKKKGLPLNLCELYILISPCVMCANEILKSNIKKVFYVNPYGNDDGIKLLRNNGVFVKRYK